MRVETYEEGRKEAWDSFVRASKNGTFLFLRDYMDYHRTRFRDSSLMIGDDEGRLTALLPAHADEKGLHSHGGLTYGGFITDERMKTPRMLEVFEATIRFLHERSVERLTYKVIPHIYHRCPAEEDLYALFLCGATLSHRSALTVIDGCRRIPFQGRRERGAAKGRKNGASVRPTDDLEGFWDILVSRLRDAHGARPVHTLGEMDLLKSTFPDHIRLYAAFKESRMVAGVLIYETERVARAQYIAASPEGQACGALDLIFSELLNRHYPAKPFFDFGTSEESAGHCLNRGLVEQKEGFGGRTVVQDHYEIKIGDEALRRLSGAAT